MQATHNTSRLFIIREGVTHAWSCRELPRRTACTCPVFWCSMISGPCLCSFLLALLSKKVNDLSQACSSDLPKSPDDSARVRGTTLRCSKGIKEFKEKVGQSGSPPAASSAEKLLRPSEFCCSTTFDVLYHICNTGTVRNWPWPQSLLDFQLKSLCPVSARLGLSTVL